jgi:hypothetical protein
MEMLKLLLDNFSHCPAELDVVDVGKQQIHCCAGRLLFAVGMVDQDLFKTRIDLPKPPIRGF